jgi:hypothetical protein
MFASTRLFFRCPSTALLLIMARIRGQLVARCGTFHTVQVQALAGGENADAILRPAVRKLDRA